MRKMPGRFLKSTVLAGSSFVCCAGLAGCGLGFNIGGHPGTEYVYVTNSLSNNISAYSIDPATGTLAAITGSPFAAGEFVGAQAVDPSCKFLYAATLSPNNNVAAFSIDPTTGALGKIPGSPFAAGMAPAAVAIRRRIP